MHCADASDQAAAFVLGALSPAEMAALREHLAGCPEAHAEFAELGSVVPALFETVELVEPPAGLRKRILDAAAVDMQRVADVQRAADTQRLTDTQSATDTQRTRERQPAVDTQRSGGWLAGLFGRPLWTGLGVAAALALVALGFWNVQLGKENAALTAYRDGVVAVLDQAAEPGAQLAVLVTGPDIPVGPSGLAAVSADGSKVSLVMRDLAPTTGTEVYEAWVISGDNAPVPIGGFKVDASRTATFVATGPTPAGPITVALTKEPAEGAKTPTAPIIALGTAESS